MDGARMLGRSWGEGEGTPTSGQPPGMKEPRTFWDRGLARRRPPPLWPARRWPAKGREGVSCAPFLGQ